MSDEPPFQCFYHCLLVAGSQQEIIIPADIPLVQEIGATLREWAQIWHKLFVVCVHYVFLINLFGTHNPEHLSDSHRSDLLRVFSIPLMGVLP